MRAGPVITRLPRTLRALPGLISLVALSLSDNPLNRFTRLIAGRSWCVALSALLATTSSAIAQRVQFPTPAQPVQATIPIAPSPYAAPGTARIQHAGESAAGRRVAVHRHAGLSPPATGVTRRRRRRPLAPDGSVLRAGRRPAAGVRSVRGGQLGQLAAAASRTRRTRLHAAARLRRRPPQPNSLYPNGLPFQYQPPPSPYGAPATPGEGYWEKTQRFLQELSLEGTYLYGKHSDPQDLAWTRAEASSTFAFPLWYNIETPLLVTPGFAFNWLQGPLTDR